ncbi:MAG: FKBP-type peptidyl-prolyl cis-trans isomerase [Patescibacteria group bacterium]
MYNKIIGIVVVVIILVGVVGYVVYTNYYSSAGIGQGQRAGDVVQAQDTVVGTGAEAVPNSIVSLLYVGKLEKDGTIFDSSEAHGNQPLTFQLGAPGIIAGFQIGINGMKEGGERIIVVPASFGYGAEDIRAESEPVAKGETKGALGAVIIPANSTIVFEVKLLKVEAAPAEVKEVTAPSAE